MFVDVITASLLLIICLILKMWAKEQTVLMAIIAQHLIEIKKKIK